MYNTNSAVKLASLLGHAAAAQYKIIENIIKISASAAKFNEQPLFENCTPNVKILYFTKTFKIPDN